MQLELDEILMDMSAYESTSSQLGISFEQPAHFSELSNQTVSDENPQSEGRYTIRPYPCMAPWRKLVPSKTGRQRQH